MTCKIKYIFEFNRYNVLQLQDCSLYYIFALNKERSHRSPRVKAVNKHRARRDIRSRLKPDHQPSFMEETCMQFPIGNYSRRRRTSQLTTAIQLQSEHVIITISKFIICIKTVIVRGNFNQVNKQQFIMVMLVWRLAA